MKINVVSPFNGMSIGMLALSNKNFNVGNYYSSEIKPHAIKVTQHNYNNIIQIGDVTKVKYKEGVLKTEKDTYKLEKCHLYIGGSPCQDFSRGNRERLGLDGVKSGLFEHWYRLYKELEPEYFLLENVVMDKFDQRYISDLLGVEPIQINSKLVSGQLRERLYWTNIGGTYIDFAGYNHSMIPQPKDLKITLSNILDSGYCPSKKSRCLLESDSRPLSTPVKMFHRYYYKGFTTLVFKDKKHFEDCKKHYDKNYRGLNTDKFILDNMVYDGVRYLTQKELELLQTVPPGYTSILKRNDAACLLGDGWTTKVIEHIFSYLPKAWRCDQ